MIVLALFILAGLLAVISLVQSRGASLVAWGLLALVIAHFV